MVRSDVTGLWVGALLLAGCGRSLFVEVPAPASRAAMVSAGNAHTCAVDAEAVLWCWGGNGNGQLGDGTRRERPEPVRVTMAGGEVAQVVTGDAHTCALLASGAVTCWGRNESGQLGLGHTEDRLAPVPVSALPGPVAAIAAGPAFTCAALAAGGIQCWGSNGSGQLGDGTTAQRTAPVAVVNAADSFVEIAGGGEFACGRTSNGGIWCWGTNAYGQLGNGSTTAALVPVPVSGLASGVRDLAAGKDHACAVASDGTVHCWGYNGYRQIGDGTADNRSTPTPVLLGEPAALVTGGYGHTCALAVSGTLYCWGQNWAGQLGRGWASERGDPARVFPQVEAAVAVDAGWDHTCALWADGGISCWGWNSSARLGSAQTPFATSAAVVAGLESGGVGVAAGYGHTCVRTSSGAVRCFGRGTDGQLGEGEWRSRSSPTADIAISSVAVLAAGDLHNCALTLAGEAHCWGYNYRGRLGDGTGESRTTPVAVVGLSAGLRDISGGGAHSCAVDSGGGVHCWGDNGDGQLGDGSTTRSSTPVPVVGLASGVLRVSCGGSGIHTCAVLEDGSARCWGSGGSGQLGDGLSVASLVPVSVLVPGVSFAAISSGEDHTCAVTTTGAAMCWGYNGDGQLGDGTTSSRSTPVAVAGLERGVTVVAAGNFHTCAVREDGVVLCWGSGARGRLGNGDEQGESRTVPTPVVGLAGPQVAIATGYEHTCAVSRAGAVSCWGYNEFGATGQASAWAVSPVPVTGTFSASP